MTSKTLTRVFPLEQARVFEYVSDIENLPRWATEFARELRVVDGKHKVVNGLGEFFFRIDADPETGVIDMYSGPTEDELALFPARVVSVGDNATALTFTMFQGPGMPDDLFESQYQSLLREFDQLEQELVS